MPNYCDCTLTITGPNRQAVLDKIKGEPWTHEKPEGEPVYFDMEKIIPMPAEVKSGGDWREWAYENWGCSCVYPDRQYLNPKVKDENGKTIWSCLKDDAEVIIFTTPWNPPLYAIQALSAMFAENTFTLEDSGSDLPTGATVFRAGKSSFYCTVKTNMLTGRTATLYEIFCAVLHRTGNIEQALAEVANVKAGRQAEAKEAKTNVELHSDDPNHDPDLDTLAIAALRPRMYDMTMIPTDEERIANHIRTRRPGGNGSCRCNGQGVIEDHGEWLCDTCYCYRHEGEQKDRTAESQFPPNPAPPKSPLDRFLDGEEL